MRTCREHREAPHAGDRSPISPCGCATYELPRFHARAIFRRRSQSQIRRGKHHGRPRQSACRRERERRSHLEAWRVPVDDCSGCHATRRAESCAPVSGGSCRREVRTPAGSRARSRVPPRAVAYRPAQGRAVGGTPRGEELLGGRVSPTNFESRRTDTAHEGFGSCACFFFMTSAPFCSRHPGSRQM